MTAMGVGSTNSSTADEVTAAAEACRRTLAERFDGLPLPPSAPRRSEEWFGMLRNFPDAQSSAKAFRLLKAETANWPPGEIELYALLQAALAAAPRIEGLPVAERVKRLFAATFAQLATPPKAWEGQFDAAASSYWEMSMLVGLQRFPAGEMVFNVTRMPGSWLMKVHPVDIPGLVHGLATRIGGIGPFYSPHLNYWRPNRLQLIKTENERSLWLIAHSAAQQPHIKGLMTDAWFYSPQVGEHFPHLTWLRAFFIEQGAIMVDMEYAQADSGVLVGSSRRRQLYDSGTFRPRRTLVLWPRADMLAWADRHPELGDDTFVADWRGLAPPIAIAKAPRRLGSGRLTLWNAVDHLNRRPKIYFLATILLPAIVAAAGIAAATAGWAAVPSFGLAFALFWVLQYFLLQ